MDSFVVGRCRKKGSFRGAQERECAGLGELMQGRFGGRKDEKGEMGGKWGNYWGRKLTVEKDGKDKLVEVKREKLTRVGISRESLLSSGVFHLRHPGG